MDYPVFLSVYYDLLSGLVYDVRKKATIMDIKIVTLSPILILALDKNLSISIWKDKSLSQPPTQLTTWFLSNFQIV